MILDIHADLGIRSQPRVIHQDDTMDSAPFKAAVNDVSQQPGTRADVAAQPCEDRADTIYPS
jgi:hypothetical protein